MSHVIIIGSGIAGLTAALTAAGEHQVTLVTKAALADANTRYAQGGIAAAWDENDSVHSHAEDTVAAGAGLNARTVVETLCAEGPDRIRDLIAAGVAFDTEGGQLARALEAAHSHPRVLHAGGDATGAAVQAALVAAVRASSVQIREHTFATDLIVRDGRVVGVEVLSAIRPEANRTEANRTEANQAVQLSADTVILATGGGGQLYRHTTNPVVATADGVAMALRAGAQVVDLEFYQFHPTALSVPGNFLVSEAVRGDGAVLRNARGERFMTEVHPDAELAPRDVVARAIAVEMAAQNGRPVVLDATAIGAEKLAVRFPTITAALKARGLDWKSPIPVTPAAHYWMGGVATDIWGRTSLPALYAVGEVAGTGVHGANRLASNSLLEGAVFGHRAARAASFDRTAEHLGEDSWPASADPELWLPEPDGGGAGSGTRTTVAPTLGELQDLMWAHSGLLRNAQGLRRASQTLAGWRNPEGDTIADRELANLLEVARALTSSALAREESRGAHFRTDFPTPSEAFAHRRTAARKVPVHADF